MLRLTIAWIYVWITCFSFSQDQVYFIPNQGQWDHRIQYKCPLNKGTFIIDSAGFLVSLNNFDPHKQHHNGQNNDIQTHTIRTEFVQIEPENYAVKGIQNEVSLNFFLGNDSSHWKSNIHPVQTVTRQELYPGIDLIFNSSNNQLEYRFIVAPEADAAQIRFKRRGADRLSCDESGNLVIRHRFGQWMETAPVCWTIDSSGKKETVDCHFRIEGDEISFELGKYNKHLTLVIDPYLVFSSFTGSTADNWGFTAAPDKQGNLLAGGIVFESGYPTTTGAYDVSFSSGIESPYSVDLGISKFSADGKQLLYSTYLGGIGNETPTSIITNDQGELYILGVTSSTNFPISSGAYQSTHKGGSATMQNAIKFTGSDLFISKLNQTGSLLLASSFLGGTGNDGLNVSPLNYNYGDQFRGEIILNDSQTELFVVTTTQSSDFPIVQGSQPTLSGTQDAIVFSMSTDLSQLKWSTYFGGPAFESGNSLQFGNANTLFICGGTSSVGLVGIGGLTPTFQGGAADGYLCALNGTNGSLLQSTFIGSNEYDQAYFVQTDPDGNVYVYGQTESPVTISPGCYGNPNAGQFIKKFTPNLSAELWSTAIGASTGHVEISPTAFLVSDCYDIYLAGWGGSTNHSSQATYSTTAGFPITPDAFQPTTGGNNFYIAVLSKNAQSLKYGTFMGGMVTSANHVDGGTSRFDKTGRIYHAVCGACGGSDNGFTTTPGVWSTTNPSSNCNLAAFKFELNEIKAIASEPQTYICLPKPVQFTNTSTNGNVFFWNFGDGTTSTQANPSHQYSSPGNYDVSLIVSDSASCYLADTVNFDVQIGAFSGGVTPPSGTICPGIPYTLDAYGGKTYLWSPAALLNDPSLPNPVATVTETTEFRVIISDSCGVDTVYTTLPVYTLNYALSADTAVCIGSSVPLSSSGILGINWSPTIGLDNPSSNAPNATPQETTTYIASGQSSDGCSIVDSVTIGIFNTPPIPLLEDTLIMCEGTTQQVIASGATNYSWSPNYAITPLDNDSVCVNPIRDTTYICTFTNACGMSMDSIYVDVLKADVSAGNNGTICPGTSTTLWAKGAQTYSWKPSYTLNTPFSANTVAKPTENTTYQVIGITKEGCLDTAYVTINLHPSPYILLDQVITASYGQPIPIETTSSGPGTYSWSPTEFLSCITCPSPVSTATSPITYSVLFTDTNGCKTKQSVTINFDALIYIPNSFTPNDDASNNVFSVVGGNLTEFHMWIYDRWGELVAELTPENNQWDGSYKTKKCQTGTYTWVMIYRDLKGFKAELTGHLNLIH